LDFLLWLYLIGFVFFVALSAVLSGAEATLSLLSKLQVKKIVEREDKESDKDYEWLDDPQRALTTTLVCDTLSNIGAGLTGFSLFLGISKHIVFLQNNKVLSVFLSFTITGIILVLLGEIVPRIYARQRASALSPFFAKCFQFIYTILYYPIIYPLLKCSSFMLRFIGIDTKLEIPFMTEEDIKFLVDAVQKQGVLEEDERNIIHSVLEFGDTVVKEIMTPRVEIEALSTESTLSEALEKVVNTSHSRLPIYKESMDNIIGILYARDLLELVQKYPNNGDVNNIKISTVIHQPVYVPENKKISELLREFQKAETHMAIVVDEYGGTAGLITIEDVLEEIVGDIRDEFDEEEEMFQINPDGVTIVDARMDIEDFIENFEIEIPEEELDFESVGGFIFSLIGHVPQKGEEIVYKNIQMVIEEADERKISKIRVTKTEENIISKETNTKEDKS